MIDKSELSWGHSINLAILNSIIFNKIDTEKSIELKEAKNDDDEFRQGMEKINYWGYWSKNVLSATAPSEIDRFEYNVIVQQVNEQHQISTLNNFILLFNELAIATPEKEDSQVDTPAKMEAPRMADTEAK